MSATTIRTNPRNHAPTTPAAAPPAAELRSVTKQYRRDDPPAVDDLSIQARPGEVLALLGPSGSGKTTALRLLAGFLSPDQGAVTLAGGVVADATRFVPPEKRGLGVVFQEYALFPHLTVADNVAFGLHRRPRRERRRLVDRALSLVDMEAHANRYPQELSGGQQQRVALARALAPEPVFLLLDEPFSSLDAGLRASVRDELADILRAEGVGALLVTHDHEDALFLGDRIAVMRRGRCEQSGTPEELYLRPANRFVAEFMGRADFLPGRVIPAGVMTELGLLEQETGLAPGAAVELAFRPDDVAIDPDPASGALIALRHFEGTSFLYHVILPSGRTVHSLQPHSRFLEVGTPVTPRVVAGHDIPCFDADGHSALVAGRHAA